MKKLIFILVILAFAGLTNAQWQITGPTNNGDIHDVYFVDANTGFASGEGQGNGMIFKTVNGGTNWTMVYRTGTTTDLKWIKSIYFVNVSTGFACGVGGFVYSTVNGGQSWSSQQLVCTTLVSIRFINASTGLTCGDADNPNRGPIFKTTNGGNSWTKVNNSAYYQMHQIYYLDANNVFASGDYIIYKSTNGGNSWFNFYTGIHDYNAIFFPNSNTGFVCMNMLFMRTTNAGVNWDSTSFILSDTNYFSSVYFTDNNTGYLSAIKMSNSYGKIFKTTNAGANWHLQQTFSNAYFRSIMFINANTGFTCGGSTNGGVVYKTTNGGGTIGIQNISNEIPSSYSLSQNYPNPFNPTTKIRFAIPNNQLIMNNVQLIVNDIMGREVATLVNESLKPGTYEATFDATNYSSGIYFYRLQSAEFTDTKRMILIK